MQIAFFTECYHPVVNGVVVSVATFTRELTRMGHGVQIYAPTFPGYCDSDLGVYRLRSLCPSRSAYPLALPFSSARVRRTLDASKPDIIHANHPFLTGLLARREARRLDRPLVFTYHTLIQAYAHYLPLPRGFVRRLAIWRSRTFSDSADCVIVPTRGTAEILRGYGVKQRIEVIPTGLDLETLRAQPRAPIRARYDLPADAPLICYSGRIAREKNVDLLLRAFAQLHRRHPDAHLLLVGGGPWEASCRARVEALGLTARVRATGFVTQKVVFDCLADSDVFVFPSTTDTQGLVVLEAMALGCPTVAVHSGAVLDILRDGEEGLIVPAAEHGIVEGCCRLLESADLRTNLAGKALRRVEDFSAGKMTVRLSQVYSSLLKGR